MEKIGGERKIWLCPSHIFPIATSLSSSAARTTCQRVWEKHCREEAPPGAESRSSFPGSRRLDGGTRQALRVSWCRRVRPALFGLRGHRDHSGCPGCQTNEDCHLGRRDVIQGQRSKAEPSFLLGPPTAPSLPRLGKGHTHKNFRHTINIFAFPPTFPMGYQLQNS